MPIPPGDESPRDSDAITEPEAISPDAAEALARLVESERRYRAIVATMQEGFMLLRADGVVTQVNPRAEQMLGRSAAQLTGGTSYDPRWTAVREDGSTFLKQDHPGPTVLRTGQPCSNVIMGVSRPDGTVAWLSVNAEPLFRIGESSPDGAVVTFRDVTRERDSDREKSEFVSQVSHELRTPLTSIKGYVELLLDDRRLTDEQREFLTIVTQNTERGIALISDLLDISRMETGRLKLALDTVNVRTLIQEVVGSLLPLTERKHQEVLIEVPSALLTAWADPQRVAQVVINLVSNAHKYTPDGGRIRVSANSDERNYVRVDVQDTGIGISAEDQAQLFKPFFRARNRVTREAGGTGLGLTVSRSLVDLHGGQMTVASQPGVGSTFSFTLPVPPPLQRRLRRADW